MPKKKDLKLEITEFFMAKADRNRCFYGTIERKIDIDGRPFVFSKINIHKGFIISRAEDQLKLSEMLDEMVVLILDCKIHGIIAETSAIAGNSFFLN